MALIICPECKKQISDQASACVYCGYPIVKKKHEKLYHVKRSSSQKSDSKKFYQFLIDNLHMCEDEANACTKYYRSFANNILLQDAQKLQKIFSDNNLYVVIEEHTSGKSTTPFNLQEYLDIPKVPKCPKCGSTHIEATQRGYSGFWGFLGSGQTMNYCKSCGHKWNP